MLKFLLSCSDITAVPMQLKPVLRGFLEVQKFATDKVFALFNKLQHYYSSTNAAKACCKVVFRSAKNLKAIHFHSNPY